MQIKYGQPSIYRDHVIGFSLILSCICMLQEADSDWAEDIAQEDDDSAAEDSVGLILLYFP